MPAPAPWYDHPYTRIFHAVLTAVLAAACVGLFKFYVDTQEQLAVLCSKIDLIYSVVVEKPLMRENPPLENHP